MISHGMLKTTFMNNFLNPRCSIFDKKIQKGASKPAIIEKNPGVTHLGKKQLPSG
jgi:hypothetical protein